MARTDYGAILSTVIQDTSQAIKEVENSSALISPRQWGEHISAFRNKTDSDNVIAQMIEETVSGSIASFTDGANNIPVKEIACHINPTETGTGEKSPSNPYVIGGHTGINVTRAGGNFFDVSTYVGSYIDISGFRLGSTYTICAENTTNIRLYKIAIGAGSTSVWNGTNPAGSSFTVTQEMLDIGRLWIINNSYVAASVSEVQGAKISLNYGNDSTYHEYITPTTYTVPFGQTVYGGTLNVTTGVLSIEFNYFRVTQVTVITDANTARVNLLSFQQPLAAGYSLTTNPFICNIFKSSNYSTSYNNHIHFVNFQAFAIYSAEEIGTEIADWNNWLANNPCYLCYKRQTPITVHLTPQEIKTLLGANNIYHDCNGDTDVTYRANGELYVEQHPEPNTLLSNSAPLSLNDTIEEQEEE